MSALVERYSELYMNKKRSKDREESVLEGILAGSGRRRNPNMARELHRAQRARRKVKYGSVASLIVLVALTTFMRIAAVFALKWNVLPRGISTAQESRNETGSWGVCKPLKTWWPGTELNRRRQPFQGCALPTELPGHFLSAQLCPQNDWRPIWPRTVRSHWAGCREAKQPMRRDRAELSDYSNPVPFAQNGWRQTSLGLFSRAFFLAYSPPAFLPGEMAARYAIHDRQRAAICAKPVRDLAIIAHVKHRQVGVFARFHAALAVGQPQRPGSVDRRRCNRLRR